MKRCFMLVSLCIACNQAVADIYKYIDANGQVTYSSAPRKGAEKLDFGELPGSADAPKTSKRNAPSPADFPKVDNHTQKTRDDGRRKILENEMTAEEKLLREARQNLQDEKNRNPGKLSDKTRALDKELVLHQKNIEALKTELGHIK